MRLMASYRKIPFALTDIHREQNVINDEDDDSIEDATFESSRRLITVTAAADKTPSKVAVSSSAVSNSKRNFIHSLRNDVLDDEEVSRPTKRPRLEARVNIVTDVDEIASVIDNESDALLLKKFKGTPQKRLHQSQSESFSSSQSGVMPLSTLEPLSNPITPKISRTGLSELLNESAKKYAYGSKSGVKKNTVGPPTTPLRPQIHHESVLKSSAKRISNNLRENAPNISRRSLIDERRFELNRLSPVPVRNVNYRFLEEEDSPTKTRRRSLSEEKEADEEFEGEMDIEEILDDVSIFPHEKPEAVEELSEVQFPTNQSHDSIDVLDTSKHEHISEIALPSMFVLEDEELYDGEEVLASPPPSPYRAPTAPKAIFPTVQEESVHEELTMRDLWLASYKSHNPLLARDPSQSNSSFIEKLSVEAGVVTQSNFGDLVDYPSSTSLMKGGLALEAMKAIELSRRRISPGAEFRTDSEGPWYILDVSPGSHGFLSARCIHTLQPDVFSDVLFKSHRQFEWISPNKLKGSKYGSTPHTPQPLSEFFVPGSTFKPIGAFDYQSPVGEMVSTPPNIQENSVANMKLNDFVTRSRLLISNFEVINSDMKPSFDLKKMNASIPLSPHFNAKANEISIIPPLSFMDHSAFSIAKSHLFPRSSAKKQKSFSAFIPNIPRIFTSSPLAVSVKGTVLWSQINFLPEPPLSFTNTIDRALSEKFGALSIGGKREATNSNLWKDSLLFVQLSNVPNEIVAVSIPRRTTNRFATVLHGCNRKSFEFRGLRVSLSSAHLVNLPLAPSPTLNEILSKKLKAVDEFPDAMDIDEPQKKFIRSQRMPSRVTATLEVLEDSKISLVDSEFFDVRTRSLDKELSTTDKLDEATVSRVSVVGRLVSITLVPSSNSRRTEFAIFHLVGTDDLTLAFSIPDELFDVVALSAICSNHSKATATGAWITLTAFNILYDDVVDRFILDYLSRIETVTTPSSSLITNHLHGLTAVLKLSRNLRYCTVVKLPSLRVVYYRSKAGINGVKKIIQPIVFKCDKNFHASPLRVTNRLKRLLPQAGSFAFRSINRGILMSQAKAEYRLAVVVERTELEDTFGLSSPMINLVLSHSFTSKLLKRKVELNASAVDAYFLHSLPGMVLSTEGLCAVMISDGEGDELPTFELVD